jgi:hypothetical protein
VNNNVSYALPLTLRIPTIYRYNELRATDPVTTPVVKDNMNLGDDYI